MKKSTTWRRVREFWHQYWHWLLKIESNPNKKLNLRGRSLEHTTLPLPLVPRSTDWANWAFDTKVQQVNIFYVMNVCKLLKKRK